MRSERLKKSGDGKVLKGPVLLTGPFVFFLSFAVYLMTLAPEVTFWDTGELIMGAVSLGNTHQPSYPIFCMLGKAFTLLPIGNAAYRTNLLSATAAAAAAYVLYRLILEMGDGRPGVKWFAAGLALCFAFLKNLWSVSVLSEMYSLNALMLITVLYLLLRYEREGRLAYLHVSAFLLGLALVNHQSVLMFIPAYAVYCILSDKNYKKPAVLFQSLFFFALGYSVILYLPIRAAASPAMNIGDPRILTNFRWEIKWPEDIAMMESLTMDMMRRLSGARLLYMLLAVAAGLAIAYLLRRRRYTLLLAASILLYYAGTTIVTAPIRQWGLSSKFYTPVYLLIGLTAASAFFHFRPRSLDGKTLGKAGGVLFVSLCLSLPLGVMAYNYNAVDNSRNFFAYDFASNTLKSVKPDAALFAWGDNGVFPVWYLQGFEKYRDDVLFLHTALLTYPWYMTQTRAWVHDRFGVNFIPPAPLTRLEVNVSILKLMLEKRTPTYFDFSAASEFKIAWEKLKPQGLVHLAPSGDAVPAGRIWHRYVLRGAFDGSTNKAFAAEGVLDIYAWESVVWAQEAYNEGRLEETLEAYDLTKKFGLSNEYLDKWTDDIRKRVAAGKNKSVIAQKRWRLCAIKSKRRGETT